MRVVVALTALLFALVSLPLAVYGGLVWVAAGVCDTTCPSDAKLAIGKGLFFGGPLLFVVSVVFLATTLRANRRVR